MSTTELLPCPFCGGEVGIALHSSKFGEYWWAVQRGRDDATACKCRLFMESDSKFSLEEGEEPEDSPWAMELKARLVEKWNRRGAFDTCSEHIEGGVMEIDPGAIQSPDTLVIGMTLRERLFAFKRVIIDLDGERHEFGADSLIRLLEGYEGESRWHELFGTPERAARTLLMFCKNCEFDCDGCKVHEFTHGGKRNHDALLEWLKQEVEA